MSLHYFNFNSFFLSLFHLSEKHQSGLSWISGQDTGSVNDLVIQGKTEEARDIIWDELQRQLDEQGYSIKRGTIQDASIITSDPGHAPADKPRGDAAKTRRSRDGSWTKTGTKSQFSYKLHSIIDRENQFIRRFDTTTASVYDSQVDLSQKGETVYRVKGYFGSVPFASMDKTMRRALRGKELSEKDKRRNRAINRTRPS